MKRFDLSKYASDGVRVLSGREKGEAVRADLELDAIDADPAEEVQVILPPEIIKHVNSSFFLGMIGESVRKLGRETFTKKYRVDGTAGVQERFRQAIDRVLLATEPLP